MRRLFLATLTLLAFTSAANAQGIYVLRNDAYGRPTAVYVPILQPIAQPAYLPSSDIYQDQWGWHIGGSFCDGMAIPGRDYINTRSRFLRPSRRIWIR